MHSLFGLEVIHARGSEVTRGTENHLLQRINIEGLVNNLTLIFKIITIMRIQNIFLTRWQYDPSNSYPSNPSTIISIQSIHQKKNS